MNIFPNQGTFFECVNIFWNSEHLLNYRTIFKIMISWKCGFHFYLLAFFEILNNYTNLGTFFKIKRWKKRRAPPAQGPSESREVGCGVAARWMGLSPTAWGRGRVGLQRAWSKADVFFACVQIFAMEWHLQRFGEKIDALERLFDEAF